MELIEKLINTQQINTLKRVKAILDEEPSMLTAEDYSIIQERRERRRRGESTSYTWEEIEAKVLQNKKKQLNEIPFRHTG